MKVGLLSSYRGQKKFEKEHWKIIESLKKHGHEVMHSLDTSIDHLIPLSYIEREKIFLEYYSKLEECDLIFAECSLQSTQVGFGLAYLRSKGRPVVILSIEGVAPEFAAKGGVYSEVENMAVYEYTFERAETVVHEALTFMEPRLDKRFSMIFPAHLLAKVEEVSHEKKLPKAAYIRQLIEKDLITHEENR